MADVIDSFDGEHEFLSNFYEAPFLFKARKVPTAEHGYQMMKATDDEDQAYVLEADTPGEAKKRGNDIDIRSNWDNIKTITMYRVVRSKFNYPQNQDLAQKLIDTGDKKLVEGNDWGDTFWGVTDDGGENQLGKILMLVRSELKSLI